MLEAIGKELKIIRIRKNLDISDVANKLNCHVETIKRWEKSSKGLSLEKLEELLDFYNIDKVIFFNEVCEDMHENN